MTRLPPLNALRAFEAAARHLSFKRAADELHVTQAAISHQVKQLEAHLHLPLFERSARGVKLTEAGRALLPVLSDAFDSILQTVEGLGATRSGGALLVSLRPYFAAKWLAPRLARFWQAWPQIALRLHHTTRPASFRGEEIDVAIWWGDGDWPGVEIERLLPCDLTAVCSPDLLQGPYPLNSPWALRWHTLLHEETDENWRRWLSAAGVPDLKPRKQLFIDDTNVRLEAAIKGQGIALTGRERVADELAAKRLVAPFDTSLGGFAYYLVYPKGALSRPAVRAFRDWIFAEAQADRGETSAAEPPPDSARPKPVPPTPTKAKRRPT
jgi:LysR family glycine cleavage system transcriptional activator